MATRFYTHTPYSLLPIDPPDCFLKLDAYFDRNRGDIDDISILRRPLMNISINLCYRMGDIELHAFLLQDLSNRKFNVFNKKSIINPWKFNNQKILMLSLLIDYLSSCKSLFDAGAIALNNLFRLELTDKEQDFRKHKFLEALGGNATRYSRFKSLVDEISNNWRDYAVHRNPPTVIPVDLRVIQDSAERGLSPRLFGEIKKGSKDIVRPIALDEVLDAIDNNDETIKNKIGFAELLDLHKKWRPQFIDFCDEVCHDIERADFTLGHIKI